MTEKRAENLNIDCKLYYYIIRFVNQPRKNVCILNVQFCFSRYGS